MKRFYTLAIAAMAVIGLALFAKPALAVHAGTGQGLTCGSCHTMHSSQGGTSVSAMGGASGSWLLLRASVTSKEKIGDFCLSCHAEGSAQGGTQQNSGVWLTTPPKVYRTTAWTNGDFTVVGAGGDFSGSGTYSGGVFTNNAGDNAAAPGPSVGKGHSINLQTADIMPPGSNSATGGIENFTCTSCHDPHGTTVTVAAINKYRNLRGNISDGGNGIAWTADIATSYVGGVGGSASGGTDPASQNNTWPVYRSSGSQNSYSGSGTAGANFARFCAQCHGNWHEDTSIDDNNWAVAGSNPTSGNFDWKRHPVNAALLQGVGSQLSTSGVSIVDKGHYDQTYGNLALGKKLPAAEVDITAGTQTYYGDEDADKVFCLSCHFAHGSPNFDILRWSYTSAVGAGSQTGNAIASDTGCQQCHNRGGGWGS